MQLLFSCVSGASLVFRFDSLAVMVGITHSELMHRTCLNRTISLCCQAYSSAKAQNTKLRQLYSEGEEPAHVP